MRTRGMKLREERQVGLLKIAGAGLLAAFCLSPFAYMILVSVSKNWDFLAAGIPFQATWENFRRALEPELQMLAYLRNSLGVAALTALIAPMIAGLAAFALTRLRLPGASMFLLAALAFSMFPPISMAGYLYRMMAELGIMNTYAALVLPYVAWVLPICLWLMAGFLASLPRELDRAAMVDGCTPWQILWRVVLPLAKPAWLSAALLAFIFAYNEFLFALVLTVDPSARTLPVGLAMFQGAHGETPWGALMAAAALSVFPIVILVMVFQKHLIGGLTRGAVKG